MKTRNLIIGVVLTIVLTSAFILNYYIDENIKAQKFSDEQIDRILKLCDYQKRMDDRNWIGLDGNKITDTQPLMMWNNSTHRLDNNICTWQTIEKYESDAILRGALDSCWTGNSEFLDDDFILWKNETHYIDTDTCLITEVIHSEVGLGNDVIPLEKDVSLHEKNIKCTGDELCLTGKITRIVDGDTIYLDGIHEIRLSLTNTPERHEIGFYDASKFTAEICPVGSQATVDQDDNQPYDVYNRMLGKVTCGEKVLNSELLYENHANILSRYCSTSEFSDEAWAQEFGC